MDVARHRDEMLLRDHEASVEVTFDRGPLAWMRLRVPPDDRRTAPCVRLLERALAHARSCGVRRVETSLDVGSPSTGALLEVLRRRVGREVGSVTLHRSGASVMVAIELPPAAEGTDASGASLAQRTPATAGRRPAVAAAPGLPRPRASVEDRPEPALHPR